MNETLIPLVLAWLTGGALGTFFFGGLWWTIRKGIASKRPALWFIVSLFVRTIAVVTGFYLIGGRHWERLILALIGFVMARLVVTWITSSSSATQSRATKEAGHAS